MSETPSIDYHNVIEACAEPGCPLCRLSEKSVDAYLRALLYELVNDPEARDQIRDTLGFCNVHAHHLLTQTGSALSIGIIYRDVVNATIRQIEALSEPSPHLLSFRRAASGEAALQALSPRKPCAACEQQAKMEALTLQALVAGLGDPALQAALRQGAGLCLPHLRRALGAARQPADFKALATISRDLYAALRTELDEFIRKNDYRFQHEAMGAEGNSWKRAVYAMAGTPGLIQK